VYDDDENFLRDVRHECNCFSASPVISISTVYADAVNAPFGTFSEVVVASPRDAGGVLEHPDGAPDEPSRQERW
jgi:hypothetical protein